MLNESDNKVRIEGVLSEIDLKETDYMKNGVSTHAIGGSIKIRVDMPINKENKSLEIPVYMFANQRTNKGTENPAYKKLSDIMTSFTSIASSDYEHADRVRITNAKITMNEYYKPDGTLVSFPRISATFIDRIKASECKFDASWSAVFAIGGAKEELDKEGVPTGKYIISGILPQYGGKVDVVPFCAVNEGVISVISGWNPGDTVRASGKLNFSQKTEIIKETTDFGEANERTVTISMSELIITGGTATPLEGEFAFDSGELKAALAARQSLLATKKDEAMKKAAAAKSTPKGFNDFGF